MALDDDIRILSGVRLFEGFTQEQLRLLAFGAEDAAGARQKLYREDDEADSAYVVVEGRISLYRERDGERVVIGTVGPGAMLGELALIADTTAADQRLGRDRRRGDAAEPQDVPPHPRRISRNGAGAAPAHLRRSPGLSGSTGRIAETLVRRASHL